LDNFRSSYNYRLRQQNEDSLNLELEKKICFGFMRLICHVIIVKWPLNIARFIQKIAIKNKLRYREKMLIGLEIYVLPFVGGSGLMYKIWPLAIFNLKSKNHVLTSFLEPDFFRTRLFRILPHQLKKNKLQNCSKSIFAVYMIFYDELH